MAQTGYTPISLYYTTTAGATPTAGNLVNGELAININTADGKLFYKDSAGVVQTLATKGSAVVGGSNTQVQYNSSGALAGSANMTFNGTMLSVADKIQAVGSDYGTYGGYLLLTKNAGNATVGTIQVGDNSSYRGLLLNQSGGNVAIGTASVDAGLTIKGGALSTNTGGGYHLLYQASNLTNGWTGTYDANTLASVNTYLDDSSLELTAGSNASYFSAISMTGRGATNYSGTIRFSTYGLERMRIDSSGNVAVGNTSTNNRFLIYTVGATAGYLQIANGSTGTASTQGLRIGTPAAGNAEIITDGAMWFSTGNTERMRITSAGNVGIGTTSPTSNLQVNGSFSTTSAYVTPTLTTGGFNIAASATYNDNSNHTVASVLDSSGVLYILGTGGNAAIPFWSNGGGGVAYRWSWIMPSSTAISAPNGTTSFTVGGTGGNTFSIDFSGGGGSLSIQRTAGSGSYQVYYQRLA